jgi:excisionase family DNA binding protein
VDDLPAMLTPGELARMLHVDAKTVARWNREGRIDAVRTPGGHRRFPIEEVLAFLIEMGFSEDAATTAVRALA